MAKRGLICCAVGLLMSFSGTLHAQIAWRASVEQAREEASRENRLLLFHFWSEDCPPCRRLESEVFNRPDVAQSMETGFVPIKVNTRLYPQIARHFGVRRIPSDVILTAEGRVLHRDTSPLDPQQFISLLNRVSSNNDASPDLAGGPPPSGYNPGSTIAQNATAPSTYAELKTRPPGENQGYANQYASQGPSNPVLPNQVLVGGGGYTANAGSPQTGVPSFSGPVANPSGPGVGAMSPGAPAAGLPGQANPWNVAATGAAPPSNSFANPNQPPQSPAAVSYPGRQNDFSAGGQAGNAGQAAPPGGAGASPPIIPVAPQANQMPQLALDGYCPVTLTEQEEWKPGDPRFGAVHRQRTYVFAGEAEQQRFLQDPDRYSPVLSGYDPVRFADAQQMVGGKRDHGVFFNGQIYLFADEASLGTFWKAPHRYAEIVTQATFGPRQIQRR